MIENKQNEQEKKENLDNTILFELRIVKVLILCLLVLITFAFNPFSLINNNMSSTNSIKNSASEVNQNYTFLSETYYDFNNMNNVDNNNVSITYNAINKNQNQLENIYEYYDFIRNEIGVTGNSIDFNDASIHTPPDEVSSITAEHELLVYDNSVGTYNYIRHQMTLSEYLFCNFTIKCVSDDFIEVQVRLANPLRACIDLVFYDDLVYYNIGSGNVLLYTDDFTDYLWVSFEIFNNNNTWRVNYQNDNTYLYLNTENTVDSEIYEIYITTASDNSIVGSWYFNQFHIINNIDFVDGYIIFDFSNLVIEKVDINDNYYLYTYLQFNINNSFSFYSCENFDDVVDMVLTVHSVDWNDLSNNRTLINYILPLLDSSIDNILVIKISEIIQVFELRLFGYCYLENYENIYHSSIYHPFTPYLNDVSVVYGFFSSKIVNAYDEYMSLNYFKIENNILYYHLDLQNYYENSYIRFQITLDEYDFSQKTFWKFKYLGNLNITSVLINITYIYYNVSTYYKTNYISSSIGYQYYQHELRENTRNIQFISLCTYGNGFYTNQTLDAKFSNVGISYYPIFAYEFINFINVFPILILFVLLPFFFYELMGKRLFLIGVFFTILILAGCLIIPPWVLFLLIIPSITMIMIRELPEKNKEFVG